MKTFFKSSIFAIIIIMTSCVGSDSYYDQITKVKSISERIADLNKSLTEIRKSEKKSALITEDEKFLEYEYPVGENDSYKATYFFDDAGCFEVGLDTYFSLESDTKLVFDEIKLVFEKDERFGEATDSNSLLEWSSKDGLISVQLDYINLDKGMISLTVFANQ
ncbi:MAG: hypothetical protein KF732_01790 [Flavobacteriales bacterium]|nr:hypothetical protein [Flavobacteriales bacterium]MBX2958664.1 hypothetical protein [Flavobacteriales bacterium]MCL4856695.1 hypothetical protein [Flavobacteriales bacterium]HRN41346.1 hypothetical protein [Vicingus sp.]HRP61428.1 hypothetical protein [Vicingus sp.]